MRRWPAPLRAPWCRRQRDDEPRRRRSGGRRPAAAHLIKASPGGLAQAQGCDGAVCSAHEISILRRDCGPDFKLVVPGLRPASGEVADQKRVMTPREAAGLGADFLVIGRPITGASDPAAAARRIRQEIAAP
jgi:orotidine-5'-phosphate decarboxylase